MVQQASVLRLIRCPFSLFSPYNFEYLALVHVSVGAALGLSCGIGATMIATTYVCRILLEVLRKAPTESVFAYSVV